MLPTWGDVEGRDTQTLVHYNGPRGAGLVFWLVINLGVTQGFPGIANMTVLSETMQG